VAGGRVGWDLLAPTHHHRAAPTNRMRQAAARGATSVYWTMDNTVDATILNNKLEN
jgi:hypothetical protein